MLKDFSLFKQVDCRGHKCINLGSCITPKLGIAFRFKDYMFEIRGVFQQFDY